MRKILFLLLLMCCCFEAKAGDLDGKYLSQSGELMFIFKGDSLYIDIAQSQRNVSPSQVHLGQAKVVLPQGQS